MTAASVREPWEGKTIEGKYPLLELLGTGPRASVFRTEFSGPNGRQNAAIKLIPTQSANIEAELSRIRGAMELSHPHLIKILDAGQCQIRGEAAIYIVMEYADENLGQVVPSRALTVGETKQMLPPLIEVLSYLHEKGFVHGRVQPSNIVAVGDTLKLSTDRVRKIADEAVVQSDNAGFAAPEAVSGKLTPASDIWSLGATLVAALARTSGIPVGRTLSIVPESMPEPFKQIAHECLQLNPSDRCTLEQIKIRLNRMQASAPPTRAVGSVASISSSRRVINAIGIPLLAVIALWGIARMVRTKGNEAGTPNITVPSSPAQDHSDSGTQTGRVPGAVAERVLPTISQGARNTITGKVKVTVRVSVNSNGEVTEAHLTTAGPSKYFANQALQSARRWRFNPPRVDGQPVASEWQLKYFFGRGGTEVMPAPLH